MTSEICSVCGEEVRIGWRHGRKAWWHREDVDHATKLGRVLTEAETQAIFYPPPGPEEDHGPEPIEVRSTPMPHKGAMSVETPSGTREVKVPGGTRTMLNLAAKTGWEVVRLTYARGPYIGAKGESLGVSDSVLLILRGPKVDRGYLWAVTSWRDTKADWSWRVWAGHPHRIGTRALMTWIKENPAT